MLKECLQYHIVPFIITEELKMFYYRGLAEWKIKKGTQESMTKILFICHGNICRSPMAEIIMKEHIKSNNLTETFHIASAATSREEIGNPVHSGTKKVLKEHGIETPLRKARQITKEDYAKYDYIIGMDGQNIRNMLRILGSDHQQKIYKLRAFANQDGDIADPWYTGDFNITYQQIDEGCKGLLSYLVERKEV